MIETITLSPQATLRCFRDTRFKQGCLSFQLVAPMGRSIAAPNALAPNVLLRGTASCPDLRSITQRLDTLYGAAVSPLARRIGDCLTTGLYCGFMDDRFAFPGDAVLAPMIRFLEELALDSPTEGGGFLPAFVESEKRNLISTIESERNDKRVYAMNRLLEEMCGEDSFGLPRLGRPEEVERLESVELYRFWQQALQERPMEIFYVGSAAPEFVAEQLAPMLERIRRSPKPMPEQSPLHPGEPREIIETMDVAQGKLCIGFTTPITGRSPAFAAMQVLNVVLGGGMTSKLFQNVREKLSLCYFIGSTYYSTKGIVTVTAGIDFDQADRTREEILRQLSACQAGEIAPEELTAAKEALYSSLRATQDSPGAIEGYYATAALSGLGMEPQAYIRAVEAVTLADVVEASRTLTRHTVYFLRGESA